MNAAVGTAQPLLWRSLSHNRQQQRCLAEPRLVLKRKPSLSQAKKQPAQHTAALTAAAQLHDSAPGLMTELAHDTRTTDPNLRRTKDAWTEADEAGTPWSEYQGQRSSQRNQRQSVSSRREPALVVFSGGTAFNGVAEELMHYTTRVAHVLPVSDDGGSTAEIVRVLGGPAVGDIRSRCLRLSASDTEEAIAVKRLLGYRLHPSDENRAKMEWFCIVEGDHELWQGISHPYRDTIKAFLIHFHSQILRNTTDKFCFLNGSVGNFFFAGARTFFRSMDAAIFLYSRVSHVPPESLVLPAVNTIDRLVLGAELEDGSFIRGQNAISHPSEQSLCNSVDKDARSSTPLPSRIRRVFYLATEGPHLVHEVFPPVNQTVLEKTTSADGIIYAMGSLYTSICPQLILKGVGESIAASRCPKMLLLNGCYDRETQGMDAADFIAAITDALNRAHSGDAQQRLKYQAADYVTAVFIPRGGQIPVNKPALQRMHVDVVEVDSEPHGEGVIFNTGALIAALSRVFTFAASPSTHIHIQAN
eukprot:jgi/Chlat1/5689/Chrsp38S05522